MLEHQKIVLKGVSESKVLFRKELLKSLIWLNAEDQMELRRWVKENFWSIHSEIINEVFYSKLKTA